MGDASVGKQSMGNGYICTVVTKITDGARVNTGLPKCVLNVTVGLPHRGNGKIIAESILILRRDSFDVTR
ncbi:hypothetical protein N7467_011921 [Penicillium canescens]|nr:hypothetical protein N7467_011921 [Penicillium canescens]